MSRESSLATWVDQASALPIAFAQVREDPLLDLAVLERVGAKHSHCAMIASGGCTASFLAASGKLATLHLIDANPAQIALTRLKLRLLQHAPPADRMKLLGHTPIANRRDSLKAHLAALGLPPEALGPPDSVAEYGPDYAGRYELLFARLRSMMSGFSDELREVLTMTNAAARAALVAPDTPLGRGIDAAFDDTMALANLVRLFGADATQNSVLPFPRHFAAQTRRAIATMPTTANPYLWQLLLGRFPEGVEYPWLGAGARRRCRKSLGRSIPSITRSTCSRRSSISFTCRTSSIGCQLTGHGRHSRSPARRCGRGA